MATMSEAIAAGIRESLYGESPFYKWIVEPLVYAPEPKGPDMSKFTEWLMEMYPKTEDYLYLTERACVAMDKSLPMLYMVIKPDPQAFLEQMKEFDEMMKEV